TFDRWMRLAALPLWGTLGVDDDGGFREALDRSGRCTADFRRARVQARQAYVYSAAGLGGWAGPWHALAGGALERFEVTNLRSNGLYRTRVSRAGDTLDDTPWLYDQAFVLFATAAAGAAGIDPVKMRLRARRTRDALGHLRAQSRGWREAGHYPYQANAHMHLLEACMAWELLDDDPHWSAMADEIVGLARRDFIDPSGGFLREFFDESWLPAPAEDGRLVEPGHQFEWAWLLTRWGRLRNDAGAHQAARALYQVGQRGIDDVRSVAVDALNDDLSVRSDQARLWPQTERLKAALILAEDAEGAERASLLDDARNALGGLQQYLEPSGLWRDRLLADGTFVDEPSPASSLYHIAVAWEQVRATAAKLPEIGFDPGEGA
ncbi:MAG TPA: AGE family epimerase/isomerase, partial [Brevundimonas sp.]|nr:AGE family epimerase/isomerase [Brevundimonas sp.]